MTVQKLKETAKTGSFKLSKYKVGLPVVSDSYKSITPKPVKIASEICVLVSGTVTLVAAIITPPSWVLLLGGLATLGGRFLLKCFSEDK
jgi:hypothetical protein